MGWMGIQCHLNSHCDWHGVHAAQWCLASLKKLTNVLLSCVQKQVPVLPALVLPRQSSLKLKKKGIMWPRQLLLPSPARRQGVEVKTRPLALRGRVAMNQG